jgi:hypothetical protein
MNNNNKMVIDFFGDGMSIFLAYIARQCKKNQNYIPHPIIRAFECAMKALDKCNDGETVFGVSHDGTENRVYQPYIVVLQKKNDKIEVKEIRNLKVDKALPPDILIIVFRIQIQLDKIQGETVGPKQMVDILNNVIPGEKFYALGARWKEARDLFVKKLKNGQVYLPNSFLTKDMIEEFETITYNTPWENYSNKLRALIGSYITEKIENQDAKIIITSPINSKIEKFKVFDSAIEFILGKSSEHLDLFNNKQ